jgi:hypothetical protein
MKKAMEKEVSFCDKCGKEDEYLTKCLSCGEEYCYECRTKHLKEYAHGIHVAGSGDGYYCKKCDKKLAESKEEPLHNAYVTIQDLKKEEEQWYANFRKRCTIAENNVQKLLNN